GRFWDFRVVRKQRGSENGRLENEVNGSDRMLGMRKINHLSLQAVVESEDSSGLAFVLGRLLLDSFEEKSTPPRPIAVPGDCAQAFLILLPVRLQVATHIKVRTSE